MAVEDYTTLLWLMIGDTPYLSADGRERIKEKVEMLKKKRMDIAAGLEYAKSLGDLSENAEYQEKKEEQMENEATIAELGDLLSRAVLIKPSGKRGVIEFGSTVAVNADNESHTYIIVGNEEADPQQGHISHESPLGKALLGKKLGAKVLVKTPKGEKELLITRVS